MFAELYGKLIQTDREVARYDAKIEQEYKASEVCRRLGAVEGVGALTATALVAA